MKLRTNSKTIPKKIKALHLASFSGNVGDIANHKGFYSKIKNVLPVEFTQLEIRKFYRNRKEMKFDESFVNMVNKHDLLVLGGGGFFDLKWSYSATGTTLDFSQKLLDGIKIPVLVNAMGYHEYDKVLKKNVDKFKKFLSTVVTKKNWFVSIRNDGSLKRMKSRFGNLTKNIITVPDSGFFYSPKAFLNVHLVEKGFEWIGLNVTNELFSRKFNKKITPGSFNILMGKCVNKILEKNPSFKIMFFPHAPQDIETIGLVLKHIDDLYKRERIMVAPLFTSKQSIDQVFNLYRLCNVIIGMRFHTNVCAIAMKIPTIGLAGHEQISSLYDELGMKKQYLRVDTDTFADDLILLLNKSINRKNEIKKHYTTVTSLLLNETEVYLKKVKDWYIQL